MMQNKGGKIKGAGKGGNARKKGGKLVPSNERFDSQFQVNATSSTNQPLSGIAFEALEEIVGFWTTKTETYKITDSWKIMKATKRGRVTWVHDLTWNDASCTIVWGDDFFFDPVDLYASVDRLNWYAQSDPNKELASYVLSKSEKELEGFDGVQMRPQGGRQETEHAAKDISIGPPGTLVSRTRQRGKYIQDPETITLQWCEGDLEVHAGDMFRVVSINGAYGEIITASRCATNTHTKPTAPMQTRTTNVATEPQKVAAKPKNAKPTRGNGADVLESISGLWVGDRGETYTLSTYWRCVKTSTLGRQQVFENLSWDDNHRLILWGSSYMFDASDLPSVQKNQQLSWYKQSDKAKLEPMFTWSRA